MDRIRTIKRSLKNKKLDALLLTSEANIYYTCGFPGKDALALLTAEGGYYLFVDSLLYDEARSKAKNVNVVCLKRFNPEAIANVIKKSGIKKLGFESGYILYNLYAILKIGIKGVTLSPTEGIVEESRAVKSIEELAKIRKACDVVKNISQKLRRIIKPGLSESKVAETIDIMIRRSEGLNSFETIVAGGPHSAWPHARVSARKIRQGESVIIDFGARISGYSSDITRTMFAGLANARLSKMHDIIRKSQELALRLIRPGEIISRVAKKVNRFIEESGFGKFILHGLGHGLGLEIHEAPRLSVANHARFREGFVFTVEPGIYVPGLGGVRIEDDFHLTQKGPEVLTR